jgi:hypothetical protein
MPTQVRPYEFPAAIRAQAESLRVRSYREAIRGSISLHSITADKIAVGVLKVGAGGGVTIDNGAITAAAIRIGELYVGGDGAAGAQGNVVVHDGAIRAEKLDVVSLSAVSSTLGTVTSGTINASVFNGGTINGSTVQLGTGLPHIFGDNTGIKAIGHQASYRFFGEESGVTASRTGAVRCNLPGSNDATQVELDAYTGWANDSTTTAAIRVRNGGSDNEQGFVRVSGQGNVAGSSSYTNASDRRLKKNIKDVKDALAVVVKLRPRTFTRKLSNMADAGFVAQEVQGVLPELVREEPFDDVPTLGITYDGFHAYTVAAIQELVARVDALEQRLSTA